MHKRLGEVIQPPDDMAVSGIRLIHCTQICATYKKVHRAFSTRSPRQYQKCRGVNGFSCGIQVHWTVVAGG